MCDTDTILKVIDCPICLNPFTEPRLLPCGHTLCTECMIPLVHGTHLNCPECRKRHRVPQDGVKCFPPNPVVIGLLDALCQVCKRNKPDSDCSHCGQQLCAKCLASHSNIKEIKSLLTDLDGAVRKSHQLMMNEEPLKQNIALLQEIDFLSKLMHEKLSDEIQLLKRSALDKIHVSMHSYKEWSKVISDKLNTAQSFCERTLISLDEGQIENWDHKQVEEVKKQNRDLQQEVKSLISQIPIFAKFHLKLGADNMFELNKLVSIEASEPGIVTEEDQKAMNGEWMKETELPGPSQVKNDYAEVVIPLHVDNISQLRDAVCSLPFYLGDLLWTARVVPHYNDDREKTLAVILTSQTDTKSRCWSCHASVVCTLLSSKPDAEGLSHEVEFIFHKEEPKLSLSNFIKFTDLMDDRNGFVDNDSITILVQIKINTLLGICGSAPTYVIVHFVTEDILAEHHGFDLFNPQTLKSSNLQLNDCADLTEITHLASETLKLPVEQIRVWPFTPRRNGAFRPEMMTDKNVKVEKLPLNDDGMLYIFVEYPRSIPRLPHFSSEYDVLLFLKKYDPQHEQMSYCGHVYMQTSYKINTFLVPIMKERGGFLPDSSLLVFEEVSHKIIVKISENRMKKSIFKSLDDLHDGLIIIFQKNESLSHYRLPTVKEYSREQKGTCSAKLLT